MRSLETTATAAHPHADGDAEFKANLIPLIPHLRAFSFTLCRRRDLAEDMAQDALIKAWRSRSSYEPGTNLKAWLFTILRNEVLSHHRRAWRQMPWDAEEGEKIAGPEEQGWASELSDVGRALFRLPVQHREALILVAVGGFSYADAAIISKAAVGTMKSRVARGRAMLAAMMEENEALPQRRPASEGNAMEQILAQLPRLTPPHGRQRAA